MSLARLATVAVALGVVVVSIGVLAVVGGERAHRSDGRTRVGSTSAHIGPAPRVRVSLGVALLDASDGHVLGYVSGVHRPVEAVYGGGRFWVFDLRPRSFVEIYAASARVIRRLRSPISDVGSYTVDGHSLWITDERSGTVTAVDVSDGHVLRRFHDLPGGGGSVGVAVLNGALWVARPQALGGRGILVKLDPRTGRVETQIRAVPGTYQLATDSADGSLWSAGTFGRVNHIDPTSGKIASSDTGGRNYYLAAGEQHAWTADTTTGVVSEVAATGTIVARYHTSPGARAVSHRDGVTWVGNSEDGTVTRIDPAGQITSLAFDHQVISLAAGPGIVLVEFGASTRTPLA